MTRREFVAPASAAGLPPDKRWGMGRAAFAACHPI